MSHPGLARTGGAGEVIHRSRHIAGHLSYRRRARPAGGCDVTGLEGTV
jgi:hypothetical protein